MKSDLKALIDKLDSTCRSALEAGAGLCLSQTHYEVEPEHFLLKLLDRQNTDLHKILRYFEINETRLVGDFARALERLKTGNSRTPALSPYVPRMIRAAWLVASIDFKSPVIRSGHIVLAVISNEELARMIASVQDSFGKISEETLWEHLTDITAGSVEDSELSGSVCTGENREQGSIGKGTRALDQYTINLTERAREGEIDPVLGRDFEIRQMIDILIRRRQNNPILTGEAGVGKTAVVEGLALRIVQGDIPPVLKNVEIRTLDLGLLQAGAGIKGEFENRLKSVIEEVKASPVPIVLFIDEAHTLIGAGGAAGSSDAANLLKPALARGELRTIAATTWSEYKKYFEKDAALTRRFQVVKVEEPEEDKALIMMRAIAPYLEKHHKVMITDDALIDTVRLSHRYINARQLPDKAVSVLDTACARVAIGLTALPAPVEECLRNIDRIDSELKILERETLTGHNHNERIKRLNAERDAARSGADVIQKQWRNEKEIAEKICAARREIHDMHESDRADKRPAKRKKELKKLEGRLRALQGETPLVQTAVDSQIISEVISGWTGIPTGRMLTDEIETVLKLDSALGERIIGQDHALAAIAQRVQTAHAGIEDPSKPTGVFLLAGPSGVGKTETALSLSEILYGGEQNIITINMSEYQEAHTVSGLKGSPPGYVGYGEGGVLTEAVRKRPYSVVLLDEIEKAHPDVTELFYQVFDKGMLEDGEGRKINFKNTLIMLTTNIGTDMIMKACANGEVMPSAEVLAEMLRPELLIRFKPAFLGRLIVVPYYPISDGNMRRIVKLKLDRIANRVNGNRNMLFRYDEQVVESIAGRCTDVDSGARNVDHILSNSLLPEMSKELLYGMAKGQQIKEVRVSMDDGGFVFSIK